MRSSAHLAATRAPEDRVGLLPTPEAPGDRLAALRPPEAAAEHLRLGPAGSEAPETAVVMAVMLATEAMAALVVKLAMLVKAERVA